MKKYLAMVVYRSEVSGEKGELLDIQTRYFEADSETSVAKMIESQKPCSYLNEDKEKVSWPLCSIMAIEELKDLESGEELVGFVSGAKEIAMLA